VTRLQVINYYIMSISAECRANLKIYFTLFYSIARAQARQNSNRHATVVYHTQWQVRRTFHFLFYKMGKRKYSDSGSSSKKFKAMPRSYKPSGEKKHHDVAHGATTFNNTAVAIKFSDMAESADSTGRVGRRINASTLEVHLSVKENGSEGTARIVFFKCIGKYTTSIGDYLTAYNSPLNADRAYPIYDKIINLTSNATHNMSINRRFKINKQLKYTSSGATDDADGAIIGVFFGVADLTNEMTFEGSTRLWFTDV